MKFEDVFITEKQTILGPDRDVGSIPITRSKLFPDSSRHSETLSQYFKGSLLSAPQLSKTG